MKIKLSLLLLLATPAFAHHHYHAEPQPWPIVSAKDARQEIFDTIYKKHAEAIDWWIQFINDRVLAESRRGSSGQWVKTDHTPDWIDSGWFKKEETI